MQASSVTRSTVVALLLAAGLGAGAWTLTTRDAGEASPGPRGVDGTTVQDDAERTWWVPEAPRRVVSLVPALTEVVVDLGAGDRLVARTRYDEQPELADLPSVGGATNPSVEVLVDVRPELVISWADEGNPRALERLRREGVPVYTARVMDFGDLRRHVRNLGGLLGRSAVADSLLTSFDRRLAAATVGVAENKRPTVAFVVWPRPLAVAGPRTFVDQIIRRGGGRNAFADARRRWPHPSPEALVARDPDVVLLPRRHGDVGFSPDALTGQPWASLSAVREGRIVQLPAHLFERPTLESPRAVRMLAERLETFRDTGAEAGGEGVP